MRNQDILSLIVQGILRGSQQAMQTAMQRLSSGLRINSAKDDPAGQAIANRMTAQVRGFGQAARNASGGISVARSADLPACSRFHRLACQNLRIFFYPIP